MSVDLLSTGAMLLQQLINGGYTVLAQVALKTISPEFFALLRDSGASAVLLVAARCKAESFWPRPRHFGLLALCGLCGVWGGQLLGAIAIKEIGAVLFSVMQPAQPVLTLAISVAIGMEPLWLCSGAPAQRLAGWLKLLGMCLTVAGAVLIVLLKHHDKQETGSSPGFGYAVLFLEVSLGACYGIFQKQLLPHYDPLTVTAWGYLFGTLEIVLTLILFIPLVHLVPSVSSVIPQPASAQFWQLPVQDIGPIVYAILLNSALGYYIMTWVNNRTGPFFYTIFFPVQFFAASLLSFIFLSPHRISYIVFVGGGLITLGLWCVLWAQSSERKHSQVQQDLENLMAGIREESSDLLGSEDGNHGKPDEKDEKDGSRQSIDNSTLNPIAASALPVAD